MLPGSVTERRGDRGQPAPTPSESQLRAAHSWSDEGWHSLPKKLPHSPGHDPIHAPHTPKENHGRVLLHRGSAAPRFARLVPAGNAAALEVALILIISF